jgi:hypothetical protein
LDIGNQYDQMALGAESDYAGRPIEPNLGNQLMDIGSQYLQYTNQSKMIDAIYGDRGTKTSSTTSSTIPTIYSEALGRNATPEELKGLYEPIDMELDPLEQMWKPRKRVSNPYNFDTSYFNRPFRLGE